MNFRRGVQLSVSKSYKNFFREILFVGCSENIEQSRFQSTLKNIYEDGNVLFENKRLSDICIIYKEKMFGLIMLLYRLKNKEIIYMCIQYYIVSCLQVLSWFIFSLF